MTRVVALATALLLVAIAPTASAAKRAAPDGFFGVDFDREVQSVSAPDQEDNWDAMARNGVESARVIFAWREAQPREGEKPNFGRIDGVMRAAAAHGIRVLPVVTLAPRWARAVPDSAASRPSDPDDYAAFLRALIERYGPHGRFWLENLLLRGAPIRVWQIWNEPDMAYQWQPRKGWQRQYGKLLARAYDAVRKADPGAKVVAAALTNYSWSSLDKLFRHADLRAHADVIAVNTYTREVDNLVEIVRRNRKVMNHRGAGTVPIWITEFGASASKRRFVAVGQESLQVTDRGMAKLVTAGYDRLVKKRRQLGVERAFWYTWASSYDSRNRSLFDFTGLERWKDFELHPRPALRAYRSRARKYEGCAKDGRARCVGAIHGR